MDLLTLLRGFAVGFLALTLAIWCSAPLDSSLLVGLVAGAAAMPEAYL